MPAGYNCFVGRYESCMRYFTGAEDAVCASFCLESCSSWQYERLTYLATNYLQTLAEGDGSFSVFKSYNLNYVINAYQAVIELSISNYAYSVFQEF